MSIVRVFPRRTRATPDDALTFTGPPPKEGLPDVQEVHISVAFTYDLDRAHQLAEAWTNTGLPVRMGGPAFHEPGGDFCIPTQDYHEGSVCYESENHKAAGGEREEQRKDRQALRPQ